MCTHNEIKYWDYWYISVRMYIYMCVCVCEIERESVCVSIHVDYSIWNACAMHAQEIKGEHEMTLYW